MQQLKHVIKPAFLGWLLLLCNTLFSQKFLIGSLKFSGSYEVPFNFQFKGTTIGGLSGIDYDAKHDEYYLISDDRSALNPARFYKAKITLNKEGIASVIFTDVMYMLQKNTEPYPNQKQDASHTPDPESIRLNNRTHQLIWCSEGERKVKKKDTTLQDASITTIDTNGKWINSYILPAQLHMHVTPDGPRQNSVFEGLAFDNDYKTLWINVEEPLYQDGPAAGIKDTNAYVRLIKFSTDSREAIAQYAYKLSPVAHEAIPPEALKINGISEILSIGNNQLLVAERSFSMGNAGCTIRFYIADVSKATNINNIYSLKNNTFFKAAEKQLILNTDALKIYIDNIEGFTFGPTLANGHQTLLCIADNNFSPLQKTQLLLFEVEK